MSDASDVPADDDHEEVSQEREDWTTRDRVWDATLTLLADRPLPFQLWRIRKRARLDQSHDRTIRRTLSVMAEAGWLSHESGSNWWHPGPRAAMLVSQD